MVYISRKQVGSISMIIKNFTKDSHRIRIITQPYVGIEHIVLGDKSVRCAYNSYGTRECPLDRYYGASRFYLVGTIDRDDDNKYAVYKLSSEIFGYLRKFVMNPNWGDPARYDVDIISDGYPGENRYCVQGIPEKPLTAEELEIQSKVDKQFLIDSVRPYPVDCVNNFIRRYKIKL